MFVAGDVKAGGGMKGLELFVLFECKGVSRLCAGMRGVGGWVAAGLGS